MAAASAGSRNRYSVGQLRRCPAGRRSGAARRRTRPRRAAGRRRAAGPPRPAPRRSRRAASSGKVPAIPASSTSTTSPGRSANVRGGCRDRAAGPQPGGGRAAVHSCRNLCRFSAWTPSSRPRTSAAAAEVASGIRRRPCWRRTCAQGAHRGGLARPGRPDPGQQQPRHRTANAVTRCRCPASSTRPGQRPRTRPARRPPTMPDSPAAVGVRVAVEQPLLGVQDGLAGVAGSARAR